MISYFRLYGLSFLFLSFFETEDEVNCFVLFVEKCLHIIRSYWIDDFQLAQIFQAALQIVITELIAFVKQDRASKNYIPCLHIPPEAYSPGYVTIFLSFFKQFVLLRVRRRAGSLSCFFSYRIITTSSRTVRQALGIQSKTGDQNQKSGHDILELVGFATPCFRESVTIKLTQAVCAVTRAALIQVVRQA